MVCTVFMSRDFLPRPVYDFPLVVVPGSVEQRWGTMWYFHHLLRDPAPPRKNKEQCPFSESHSSQAQPWPRGFLRGKKGGWVGWGRRNSNSRARIEPSAHNCDRRCYPATPSLPVTQAPKQSYALISLAHLKTKKLSRHVGTRQESQNSENLKPEQPGLHNKIPSQNSSSNKITMQQKLLSKHSGLTSLHLLSLVERELEQRWLCK